MEGIHIYRELNLQKDHHARIFYKNYLSLNRFYFLEKKVNTRLR
jgi:hypothetical protein